jgi:ribosomal subunit interface protein
MQIRNANPPIQVTGRHVSVTEAMKEYCRRKVATLHLDYPKIIEVQVILDVQKYRHLAEVILHCSNHITLEASAVSSDMYASIDQVVDRIGRQMRKYKTRLMQNHRPRKQAVRHLEEQILRWQWTEPKAMVEAVLALTAMVTLEFRCCESVPVTVSKLAVTNVTALLKVCTPLSLALKVYGAGVADPEPLSDFVNATVPR